MFVIGILQKSTPLSYPQPRYGPLISSGDATVADDRISGGRQCSHICYRVAFGSAGLLTISVAAGSFAQAQHYPSNVIRIVVPTGPGSPPDILSRIIATDLLQVRAGGLWSRPAGRAPDDWGGRCLEAACGRPLHSRNDRAHAGRANSYFRSWVSGWRPILHR